MRGIREERLKAILHNQILTPKTQSFVQYLIDDECKELQEPWIPIDENVPNDRPILLFFRGNVNFQAISEYNHQTEQFAYQAFTESTPTHYKELPDDPVEIHKPEPPR